MVSDTWRDARMILAALPGLGPISVRKFDRELEGGAAALLQMNEAQRQAWCRADVCRQLATTEQFLPLAAVHAAMNAMPAVFLTDRDADYPQRLMPYPDRPLGLYRYRADASLGDRCVAIVGTRRPTSYGRKQARIFAARLAEAGFTIVSGMAEGIDTEAHRATLAAGGRTAAVLGGGLKRCYPSSNRGLMEDIAKSGGVWSEFPLWRSADRRSFPQRNRIVSGVSEAVIVVESGASGGSLITARMAAEQGKPVFVIPGRIDSPESSGCHALIRDGAQLVSSPNDILEEVAAERCSISSRETLSKVSLKPDLQGTAALIWTFLNNHTAASMESLANELKLPVACIGSELIQLEIDGWIAKRLDGRYEIL